MSFLHTMPGPDFLALYVFWFLFTWIGMLIFRHKVLDSPITTITGFGLFEGLGVARYIVGSEYGMHNWDHLIAMMVVGAVFFVVRSEHMKTGSSGSGGSCGGGGCGGGGCGGGGCGGCGG